MAQPGSNGFEPLVKHFEAFEAVDAKILAERMAFMSRCREFREEQKRIKKMVKAEGFSVREFAGVLKKRGLLAKIDALEEDLAEDGDIETYEQMQHALGMLAGTPLGEAVLDKAHAKAKAASDAVDSLVTDEFEAADPNKAAAEANASKIEEGIKPLH